MQRFARGLVAIAILSTVSACGDDDGDVGTRDAGGHDAGALDAGTTDAGAADAGASDGGVPGRLGTLVEEIATAQCDALFRCCDDGSIEGFFSQYRAFPGLPSPFTDLQDRIPPDATLDHESCVELLVDLHERAPFGPWLEAAAAGEVTLDEDALDACIASLEDASCGPNVAAALRDTDCFAYLGSSEPDRPRTTARSFFVRAGGAGASCRWLEDGSVDAYGSCDPSAAFCCVPEEGGSDCSTSPGEGTCVATAALGETCSDYPFLPCQPGLVCKPGASIEEPSSCVAPATTEVANGEACRDESYWPIGMCGDGFCNWENECEALRADGESCDEGRQCESGSCEGEPGAAVCATWSFCASRD